MKKTFFILLLCFLIVGSFGLGLTSQAAGCPTDVVTASNGLCGETAAVKDWCCVDPTASGFISSDWELLDGYCGSPDGAGGKYSIWKCGKKKVAATCASVGGTCKDSCKSPEVKNSIATGCATPTPNCCISAAVPTTPTSGGSGSSSSTAATSVDLSKLSPVGNATPADIIGRVIKAILGVVGALALFMFVYGGMLMLTSAGSPEKVKKGKDVLVWAIIGLAVIFGSFYLVDFAIKGITGGSGIGSGGSVPPPSGPPPSATQTCAVKYATSPNKECIPEAHDCKATYLLDETAGLCPTAEKCCYTIPPVPVCGNGKEETGEECDDGNTIDGDDCSSTCEIE